MAVTFDFREWPNPDPSRKGRPDWDLVPVEPFFEAALCELAIHRLDNGLLVRVLEMKGEKATVLESFHGTDLFHPAWTIAYMQPSKTLVVVVRGTTNNRQWVTHAGGLWGREWKGFPDGGLLRLGYVHSGIHHGSSMVITALHNIIDQTGKPNRIVLVGHSYGGGVCNILYETLQNRFGADWAGHCITFGQPRVFAGLKRPVRWPQTYYRLQNVSDRITSVPLPILNVRGLLTGKGIAAAISAARGGQIFAWVASKLGGQIENVSGWVHWGRGINATLGTATTAGNVWAFPEDDSAEMGVIGPDPVALAEAHYMDTGYMPWLGFWGQAQGYFATPHGKKLFALAKEIMAIPVAYENTPDWRGIQEELAELSRQMYTLPPDVPSPQIARSEGAILKVVPRVQTGTGTGNRIVTGGFAMAATKITMFFTAPTGVDDFEIPPNLTPGNLKDAEIVKGTLQRMAGWSESFWHGSPDHNTVLLALAPDGPEAGTSVWAYRIRLLPKKSKLVGYRLQTYDFSSGVMLPIGGARVFRLGLSGTSEVGVTDTPGSAVELRMRFREHDNCITLRVGNVPDLAVVGGELVATNRNYHQSIVAYINRLADAFGSVIEDLRTVAPQKVWKITQTDAEKKLATVTGMVALTGFTAGRLANVRRSTDGCRRQRGGKFRIKQLIGGGSQIELAGWSWGNTKGGTVFPYNRVFATFDPAGSIWVQSLIRKVGAPFDRYVGRRKAKTP